MTTTFQIWYMKPNWFQIGLSGEKKPNPDNLEKTHIHLKDLELEGGSAQLERCFWMMQGENWSPNGEACSLLEEKGLMHTSMSIGDVVVVDNKAYLVDVIGFNELGDV